MCSFRCLLMERFMKCCFSMNLAFPVYRLGQKTWKKPPRGVQNACSSYDPLKNLLRNDKKCFFGTIITFSGVPGGRGGFRQRQRTIHPWVLPLQQARDTPPATVYFRHPLFRHSLRCGFTGRSFPDFWGPVFPRFWIRRVVMPGSPLRPVVKYWILVSAAAAQVFTLSRVLTHRVHQR